MMSKQAIKGRRKISNRRHNLTYSRVRPSNIYVKMPTFNDRDFWNLFPIKSNVSFGHEHICFMIRRIKIPDWSNMKILRAAKIAVTFLKELSMQLHVAPAKSCLIDFNTI